MSLDNYLQMQVNHYQSEPSKWGLINKNPIVGGYRKHTAWED